MTESKISTAHQRPIDKTLKDQIKQAALNFGFQQAAFSRAAVDHEHQHFENWLAKHYHGEMQWMLRHKDLRMQPTKLLPKTLSVIVCRMDYLCCDQQQSIELLDDPEQAYVSRYAVGRDYHKLIRKRLKHYAEHITQLIGPFGFRVFTDSAPVLEKAFAVNAGIGWQGKHSNILHRDNGSWFFLGEIFTDLELPPDSPVANHCGTCTACMDYCPTAAIVEPYVVDSRRCISYLTIEHPGSIPFRFRKAIGNRIYGCDDCQLYCPWNRFAKMSQEMDFKPRNQLDRITLLECFNWSEQEFNKRLEGSAIRRIGYFRWRRNLAIALGNARSHPHIIQALEKALIAADEMLGEHIHWALQQHTSST